LGKKNPLKTKAVHRHNNPSYGLAVNQHTHYKFTVVKIPKCIEIASKYYKYAKL
jgi:hypothetical protein